MEVDMKTYDGLDIEFLKSELNFYSLCEFWGKIICFGVEFLDWKILF
jgi:hypothetical protein